MPKQLTTEDFKESLNARVAAKSAQDAKPAQRKGRSAGAEENHQKAKSKGA